MSPMSQLKSVAGLYKSIARVELHSQHLVFVLTWLPWQPLHGFRLVLKAKTCVAILRPMALDDE